MSYTIGIPEGPHVLYIGVPLGPHVPYHRGTSRPSCPIPLGYLSVLMFYTIGIPLGPHVLYHRGTFRSFMSYTIGGTFRSSCPIHWGTSRSSCPIR